jgi:hypothetical protein
MFYRPGPRVRLAPGRDFLVVFALTILLAGTGALVTHHDRRRAWVSCELCDLTCEIRQSVRSVPRR